MACPVIVNETVCEQATIQITPNITVTEIETVCIGDPAIGPCPGAPLVAACTFMVHQLICAEVELSFDANATVMGAALVCGTPTTGECPGEPG